MLGTEGSIQGKRDLQAYRIPLLIFSFINIY